MKETGPKVGDVVMLKHRDRPETWRLRYDGVQEFNGVRGFWSVPCYTTETAIPLLDLPANGSFVALRLSVGWQVTCES